MTDTPKRSTATTARRPDCVTEVRRGNTVLVVSGYFKQGTTATAADKMMKVLEAESAAGGTAALQGESNSISNQKRILEAYAKQNGFSNLKWYTDDGFSGANFQRPGFQSMLADIEAGLVGTVIVKDMSRLGRNYLQVGMYTEMIFPQNGVRFIAINDGVDSAQGENDFAPLRNIFKNTRHLGGVNC